MINDALEEYLPKSDDIVSEAMKYSVRNGGKRIRPMLTLEFCKACGAEPEKALPFAFSSLQSDLHIFLDIRQEVCYNAL